MAAAGCEIRPRVVELAVRLASTDGGVVRPMVVLCEGEMAPDVHAIEEVEQRLAVLGVDLPAAVRVDRTLNTAVDHEVMSYGASAVVIDDADGRWRDALGSGTRSSDVPVLILSNVGAGVRRVVACRSNGAGASLVDEMANRLAPPRTQVVSDDGNGETAGPGTTDLVVATLRSGTGAVRARALTVVTLM